MCSGSLHLSRHNFCQANKYLLSDKFQLLNQSSSSEKCVLFVFCSADKWLMRKWFNWKIKSNFKAEPPRKKILCVLFPQSFHKITCSSKIGWKPRIGIDCVVIWFWVLVKWRFRTSNRQTSERIVILVYWMESEIYQTAVTIQTKKNWILSKIDYTCLFSHIHTNTRVCTIHITATQCVTWSFFFVHFVKLRANFLFWILKKVKLLQLIHNRINSSEQPHLRLNGIIKKIEREKTGRIPDIRCYNMRVCKV